MNKALPSIETLRCLLEYDPETGELFWANRERGEFATDLSYLNWRTVHAGKRAGAVDHNGYRRIGINMCVYSEHRVCWKIATGHDPAGVIDHINGNRADNRLINLRDVTDSENQKNAKRPKNNTSGIVGVTRTRTGSWHAHIRSRGEKYHLGTFKNFDTAVAVRRAAEIEFGFHPNHGKR